MAKETERDNGSREKLKTMEANRDTNILVQQN